jgi:hypothetical protein
MASQLVIFFEAKLEALRLADALIGCKGYDIGGCIEKAKPLARVERHRIVRLCLCLVHLLSLAHHNPPHPNRHHHCSRRLPVATPLTGVRGFHTAPSAAPFSAPLPVRPLDCRSRKTSVSRTPAPALLSSAAPTRYNTRIELLQPIYQAFRASRFYPVERSRTPTHHSRPWRRRPLRVPLSRRTRVSAPPRPRESHGTMLFPIAKLSSFTNVRLSRPRCRLWRTHSSSPRSPPHPC